MICDLCYYLCFLVVFVLGLLVGLGGWYLQFVDCVLIFFVIFSMIYLGIMVMMLYCVNVDFLCCRVDLDDEGMLLIVLIVVGLVVISFGLILLIIVDLYFGLVLCLVLVLLLVLLGWVMIYMVMVFYYVSIWYVCDVQGQELCNLEFLGDVIDVGIWDFLYYSFIFGMMVQILDVVVLDMWVWCVMMLYLVFLFFYNMVLLVLVVNVGILLG